MFYRLFLNRRIGIVIGVEFIDSVCDELLVDLIGNIEFSCFIRSEDKCVYLSISDVRYWKNAWYEHILIRLAKDETDFHGGQNHYTDIPHMKQDIEHLFRSVSF